MSNTPPTFQVQSFLVQGLREDERLLLNFAYNAELEILLDSLRNLAVFVAFKQGNMRESSGIYIKQVYSLQWFLVDSLPKPCEMGIITLNPTNAIDQLDDLITLLLVGQRYVQKWTSWLSFLA
jgi:hypothetical protein